MKLTLANGLLRVAPFFVFLNIALPQSSHIKSGSVQSTLLGTQMYFNVLLPENYDAESDYYPVVYLFRGHQDEWVNPNQDASINGNIKTVMDSVYGAGRVGKMILVMPGLSAPSTDLETDYVAEELIPYIDANYRTLPTRWARGIDGFSYGGYTVIKLLWYYPQLFSAAGSYDGSFWAFDMSLFSTASDSYWQTLSQIKFLLHSATGGPSSSNQVYVEQFVAILSSHGIQNSFSPLAVTPDAVHNWRYAYLHTALALPLHWQQFQANRTRLPVSILQNPFGQKVSGTVTIEWTTSPVSIAFAPTVQYSRNGGKTWATIQTLPIGTDQFNWNTTTVPDGTRYHFRVWMANDSLFGCWQTTNSFTIDNPGNGLPDVLLLSPQRGQTLNGTGAITWQADDPESDPLTISLYAQHLGGSWEQIVSGLPNSGSYSWNTVGAANSPYARIRIRCSDGQGFSEDTSAEFQVWNQHVIAAATAMVRRAGTGTPLIQPVIVAPGDVKNHVYRVTFDDTSTATLTYTVRDLQTTVEVVLTATELDGLTEGPLFDGLRLLVRNYQRVVVNEDSTGWQTGGCTLVPAISLPQFQYEGTNISGIPYPADYRITMSDHIVDTSRAYFGAEALPMKFQVWNVTDNHKAEIVFSDADQDQTISMLDAVIIIERDQQGSPEVAWSMSFQAVANPVAPKNGDVFRLSTYKPATSADVFEFTPTLTGISHAGRAPVEFVLNQNYPNPFNPSTTITFSVARKSVVKLTVYDELGRLVATLIKGEMNPGFYTARWNAENNDGRKVASGVYYFRLEAGSASAVRKMILIK